MKINGLSNQTALFIFLRYRLINLSVWLVFRGCYSCNVVQVRAWSATILRNHWYAWHMRASLNPRRHATAERRRFIRKQRQSDGTLTDLHITRDLIRELSSLGEFFPSPIVSSSFSNVQSFCNEPCRQLLQNAKRPSPPPLHTFDFALL